MMLNGSQWEWNLDYFGGLYRHFKYVPVVISSSYISLSPLVCSFRDEEGGIVDGRKT